MEKCKQMNKLLCKSLSPIVWYIKMVFYYYVILILLSFMAFLLIPELQFSRHLNFFPILDLHPSVLRIFFWDHPQRCSRDCMEYKHSYPIWLHAMQASLAHYTFFSSKIYFRQSTEYSFMFKLNRKIFPIMINIYL